MSRKATSQPPHRQSLIDLFSEFAALPAEFLLYDNGYRSWQYTYAQVGHAARTFAVHLHSQGIGKGDKVILWSENRPEWVAAFWGCVLRGVVVVPIDYIASADFLRRVQAIVNARLILVGEEVRLPAWENRPAVYRLSELDWTQRISKESSVHLTRDDVAEIVFTSGATGEPKGVLITHGNILSNLVTPEMIILKHRKWFRPLFPLRFLNLIPLSHMFGQIAALFIVPLIPGAAVFMRGYSPHEITRQIRTRHVSVVIGVPKILEVLRAYVLQRFPKMAEPASAACHWIVRCWRYRRIHALFGWKFWAFFVGAASLARELEEFWHGLGFAVIQGYGLTETAPIVAFNNPFDIRRGTVGKPISGVEIKIAPDGEIFVRGESVTPGYYQAPAADAAAFQDGWFQTGDLGEFDASGNLLIRGRKKEMIVTPEGLNVFPEDVERVLDRIEGVRESAVVGRDRVHAVLVLEDAANPDEIVRHANLQLETHQKIRSASVWPGERLPRTAGTQKIRHAEVQDWVDHGSPAAALPRGGDLTDLVRRYAPDRVITPETTLEDLGLRSLDRVELLMDLEQRFDTSLDESVLTGSRTVADLVEISVPTRTLEFPVWNRSWLARAVRNGALALLWLPLTRMIARAHVSGRQYLIGLHGPVIFAANHQSHLDTPAILAALPARFRYHAAPAMWMEYFDAHFFPERHGRSAWIMQSIAYWLVSLFFNSFPLPQTEAGAGQSLRYLGDLVSEGWSILFFPEGERTETGEIGRFQPGIGLIASRLNVPVVPIRLRGLERVLSRRAHWLRPVRIEIAFGSPLHLRGEDYTALAKQVEAAVRAL